MSVTGLVDWTKKVHISFKKNPPVEFSGYGPVILTLDIIVVIQINIVVIEINRIAT